MVGSSSSSESRKVTTSPLEAAKPVLQAVRGPEFSWKIAVTRGPKLSITDRESSVEPSSTTITSRSGQSTARALRIAAPTNRS